MRDLVRLTTACISGLDSDDLMKSFCMSCNTSAVFDRPMGGKGAPFMSVPFDVLKSVLKRDHDYQIVLGAQW
jgi:hypothetical protein